MTEIKLFSKQKETVDTIEERLKFSDQHSIYLSGELGVGKTYMGVSLIQRFMNDENTNYTPFVVVPSIVMNKWKELLKPLGKVVTLNRSGSKKHEFKADGKIYIISVDHLNTFTENFLVGKECMFDDTNKMFLMFDEIHLAKKSKLNALKNLTSCVPADVRLSVFLTGTITEGESRDIAEIIYTTHYTNTPIEVTHLSEMVKYDFPKFIAEIWQYISVSIALDEIDEIGNKTTEERQEIQPIDYIPLDLESKLLSEVIYAELSTVMNSTKRVKDMRLKYLDDPNKDLVYKKRGRHSQNRILGGNKTILGLPLADLNISHTHKFIKLVEIVENNPNDKVLVYVNDYELMKRLSKTLNNKGIATFYLNNSVKKENYSNFINEQFETNRVGIVDPSKVNVGVDIHAEQLVWYQFMTEIDKMIQAQRRVARLSSKYKSKVTLFVYDDEFDRDRALELSNAFKNNATTYGVKQEDNLTRLTGIILEGIN